MKNNLNQPTLPFIFDNNKKSEPIVFIQQRNINIDGIKKSYYYANNIGEVYNIKGQLINPMKINSGYLLYRLYTGNKGKYKDKYKRILAHRLFINVFFPELKLDNYIVDHINMDKCDNRLSNLEVVTQSENNRRKELYKPNYGINNYKANFSRNQLKIIIDELDKNSTYSSILNKLGLEINNNNKNSIGNIKRGITYKNEVKEIREQKFNDYPEKE